MLSFLVSSIYYCEKRKKCIVENGFYISKHLVGLGLRDARRTQQVIDIRGKFGKVALLQIDSTAFVCYFEIYSICLIQSGTVA